MEIGARSCPTTAMKSEARRYPHINPRNDKTPVIELLSSGSRIAIQ